MTVVGKMNHKYGANNHVYFISQDQMGRESQSKKKETRANGQMDNTNRKCIFGNDFLQGTQSNVGFSAVAVGFFGHNYPFFHIVYLPCTSQCFVKSLCSFLCLVKF